MLTFRFTVRLGVDSYLGLTRLVVLDERIIIDCLLVEAGSGRLRDCRVLDVILVLVVAFWVLRRRREEFDRLDVDIDLDWGRRAEGPLFAEALLFAAVGVIPGSDGSSG